MSDATLSQGNHLIDLILRENNSKDFAQNLIENWGKVQSIGRGIGQYLQNPFSKEKVEQDSYYPKGYQLNLVKEQLELLKKELPWLNTDSARRYAYGTAINEHVDGFYVVPKPSVLAEHLGINDVWANFGLLTEKGPVAALQKQRRFTNYRAGKLGSDLYRLAESVKSAFQALETDQAGDVLVIQAQTGSLYAGFSIRNARFEIEHTTTLPQFPLPAYVVGWILFCNAHRIDKCEHLIIDCPGDECKYAGDVNFASALFFSFLGDRLYCSIRPDDNARNDCGSASGFLR